MYFYKLETKCWKNRSNKLNLVFKRRFLQPVMSLDHQSAKIMHPTAPGRYLICGPELNVSAGKRSVSQRKLYNQGMTTYNLNIF
jgi:hypothetical protein